MTHALKGNDITGQYSGQRSCFPHPNAAWEPRIVARSGREAPKMLGFDCLFNVKYLQWEEIALFGKKIGKEQFWSYSQIKDNFLDKQLFSSPFLKKADLSPPPVGIIVDF